MEGAVLSQVNHKGGSQALPFLGKRGTEANAVPPALATEIEISKFQNQDWPPWLPPWILSKAHAGLSFDC